jgi:hypothetical protein
MNHTRTLLYQNGYVYPSIGRHIPVELVSPKKITTPLKKVVTEPLKKVVVEDGVLFKNVEFRKPFYFIIAGQFHITGDSHFLNIGKKINIENKNVYKLCHVEVSFEGQITNDTMDLIIYAVHLGKKHELTKLTVTPSYEKSVHISTEFKDPEVLSFCAELSSEAEGYLSVSVHGSMSTTVE